MKSKCNGQSQVHRDGQLLPWYYYHQKLLQLPTAIACYFLASSVFFLVLSAGNIWARSCIRRGSLKDHAISQVLIQHEKREKSMTVVDFCPMHTKTSCGGGGGGKKGEKLYAQVPNDHGQAVRVNK